MSTETDNKENIESIDKEEHKQSEVNISKQLYDISQLSANDRERGSEIIFKIFGKILKEPNNTKYHSINCKKIEKKLVNCPVFIDLLFYSGFHKSENGESFIFNIKKVSKLKIINDKLTMFFTQKMSTSIPNAKLEETITNLIAMGFEREQVISALEVSENNPGEAYRLLAIVKQQRDALSEIEKHKLKNKAEMKENVNETKIMTKSNASNKNIDETIANLVQMGFKHEDVLVAMRISQNNPDEAYELLTLKQQDELSIEKQKESITDNINESETHEIKSVEHELQSTQQSNIESDKSQNIFANEELSNLPLPKTVKDKKTDASIESLVEMGFKLENVLTAMIATNNNPHQAYEHLIEKQHRSSDSDISSNTDKSANGDELKSETEDEEKQIGPNPIEDIIKVSCGMCGCVLYQSLQENEYEVIMSSYSHLEYIILTNIRPVKANVSRWSAKTRLNCKNHCHDSLNMCLIDNKSGSNNIKDYRYGIFCGILYARVTGDFLGLEHNIDVRLVEDANEIKLRQAEARKQIYGDDLDKLIELGYDEKLASFALGESKFNFNNALEKLKKPGFKGFYVKNNHLFSISEIDTHDREKGVEVLFKIFDNVLQNKNKESFHVLSSEPIYKRLGNIPIFIEVLLCAGFKESSDGKTFLFDKTRIKELESVADIIKAIRWKTISDFRDYISKSVNSNKALMYKTKRPNPRKDTIDILCGICHCVLYNSLPPREYKIDDSDRPYLDYLLFTNVEPENVNMLWGHETMLTCKNGCHPGRLIDAGSGNRNLKKFRYGVSCGDLWAVSRDSHKPNQKEPPDKALINSRKEEMLDALFDFDDTIGQLRKMGFMDDNLSVFVLSVADGVIERAVTYLTNKKFVNYYIQCRFGNVRQICAKDKIDAVTSLSEIFTNVLKDPNDENYTTLNMNQLNINFKEYPIFMEMLHFAGFFKSQDGKTLLFTNDKMDELICMNSNLSKFIQHRPNCINDSITVSCGICGCMLYDRLKPLEYTVHQPCQKYEEYFLCVEPEPDHAFKVRGDENRLNCINNCHQPLPLIMKEEKRQDSKYQGCREYSYQLPCGEYFCQVKIIDQDQKNENDEKHFEDSISIQTRKSEMLKQAFGEELAELVKSGFDEKEAAFALLYSKDLKAAKDNLILPGFKSFFREDEQFQQKVQILVDIDVSEKGAMWELVYAKFDIYVAINSVIKWYEDRHHREAEIYPVAIPISSFIQRNIYRILVQLREPEKTKVLQYLQRIFVKLLKNPRNQKYQSLNKQKIENKFQPHITCSLIQLLLFSGFHINESKDRYLFDITRFNELKFVIEKMNVLMSLRTNKFALATPNLMTGSTLDEITTNLIHMGFKREDILSALARAGNNIGKAIKYLVEGEESGFGVRYNVVEVRAYNDHRIQVFTSAVTVISNDIQQQLHQMQKDHLKLTQMDEKECKRVIICDRILRVIEALEYYQLLNVNNEMQNKNNLIVYCTETCPTLLNDWIHVLMRHNTHGDLDAIFKTLTQQYHVECKMGGCIACLRHYRNRRQIQVTETDELLIFYRNLLDQIHCHLLHLYDVGLRVKKKHIDEVKDSNDN
eukprot:196967_1